MSAPETPPKKHGCFFYGCLTALGLTLLAAVVIVLSVAYLVHWLNARIVEYTDTEPVALPKVEMTTEQLDGLKKRVNDFGSQIMTNSNTPALMLDTRECNALLRDTGTMKDLKLAEHFYLSLEGDSVKAQVSAPLDKFDRVPFLKTKGRYLNGVAELGATVTNGELQLTIKSVQAKGKTLPSSL